MEAPDAKLAKYALLAFLLAGSAVLCGRWKRAVPDAIILMGGFLPLLGAGVLLTAPSLVQSGFFRLPILLGSAACFLCGWLLYLCGDAPRQTRVAQAAALAGVWVGVQYAFTLNYLAMHPDSY